MDNPGWHRQLVKRVAEGQEVFTKNEVNLDGRRGHAFSLAHMAICGKLLVAAHWGIENSLHRCLDISFREDHCRVRKDHAPNFAILRHMATNLLKREKSSKAGLQTKRLKAAWGS